MHQTSGRWGLGLALSLLTVFLWGILPIALKVSLQVLDVYTIIWFRFLVSFLILAVFLGINGKLPTWPQLRASSGKLLAIATLGLGCNYLLFMQGLALTSPANAEVLIQLAPLLLSLGGLVIFKEHYTLPQWLGVGILTCGYIVFFNDQLSNLITATRPYIIGSSLIILAAAAWAIYALCQKQLLHSLTSSHIMLIIYGGCALLFTPFAQPGIIFTLNASYLIVLLFCAFNTLIAYGAFAESLAHLAASKVSAVLALAPIITLISVASTSVFLPSLIAPEHLTIIGIFGALLVVAGSVAIASEKAD
jgi:drug/metabolite transporter (DMT)-like permease